MTDEERSSGPSASGAAPDLGGGPRHRASGWVGPVAGAAVALVIVLVAGVVAGVSLPGGSGSPASAPRPSAVAPPAPELGPAPVAPPAPVGPRPAPLAPPNSAGAHQAGPRPGSDGGPTVVSAHRETNREAQRRLIRAICDRWAADPGRCRRVLSRH